MAKLVFITGTTGFIGSHVLSQVLSAGFNARVSIRKPEQADKLRSVFAEHKDKLEFVVIPDLTKPDAFAGKLTGVTHVFHLASPMPGSAVDLKTEFIAPAVQGTEAVLREAQATSSVEQVAITSSVLGLMSPTSPSPLIKDNTGTKIEVDLNMDIPEGRAGGPLKYQISKILAHQATLDYVEKYKPSFDLVTFHPVYVVGPSLLQTKAEEIDAVNGLLVNSLRSPKPFIHPVFVDVRDVATAFVRVMTAAHPTGPEFLLSGSSTSWEDIISICKENFPDFTINTEGPFQGAFGVDTTHAQTALAMKWTPIETTVKDLMSQQLAFQ